MTTVDLVPDLVPTSSRRGLAETLDDHLVPDPLPYGGGTRSSARRGDDLDLVPEAGRGG